MADALPSLLPTCCLPFEADECRALIWLPLAVRYKLDACGLKLSLQQWQSLAIDQRATLVRELVGTHGTNWFERMALNAGATRRREDRPVPPSFAEYVRQKRFGSAVAVQACGPGSEAHPAQHGRMPA